MVRFDMPDHSKVFLWLYRLSQTSPHTPRRLTDEVVRFARMERGCPPGNSFDWGLKEWWWAIKNYVEVKGPGT